MTPTLIVINLVLSLVATAAFFGGGILVMRLLGDHDGGRAFERGPPSASVGGNVTPGDPSGVGAG